ncbi:hypothetical protein, partial [Kineococcus glutinatus]|uniref:hypothetical protein n=1 Tax=Kineococcus glutinatus TaxID=1070872 RepID=UPI0031F059DB
MKITKKVVAAGTAGLISVGGLGLIALGAQTAAAATSSTESGATSRLQAIKDALAGLVTDGSITQEQADEVATTLESSDALRGGRGGHGGGFGGKGFGLDAAATALGMSAEDLRTALQADGATLASIAEDEGVDEQTVIDALVAAATERLNQAVTDGRLTQEQADERIAELPEQVKEQVESEFRGGAGRGAGPHGGDAPATDGGTTEAPSSTT